MSDEREYRTQVLRWFVEIGHIDGNGVGYWDDTVESVEVPSEKEAEALRDKWINEGKLKRTHWGELRPNFDYGAFRIRSKWEDAADRIEALEAQLAEARMQSLSDLGQAQEAYEAQLKAEANYKEAFQMYVDANEARINAEAQLAEAVAALQFYAGPHEYPSEGPWGLNSQDFGAKAAVALHKITKAD